MTLPDSGPLAGAVLAQTAIADAADLSDYAALIEHRQDLAIRREEIGEQIEAIDAVLRSAIGDKQAGLVGGAERIRYRAHTRTALDSLRLRRELPDIWAEFSVTTNVRRFTVLPAGGSE